MVKRGLTSIGCPIVNTRCMDHGVGLSASLDPILMSCRAGYLSDLTLSALAENSFVLDILAVRAAPHRAGFVAVPLKP
jgi:hypothetical protein